MESREGRAGLMSVKGQDESELARSGASARAALRPSLGWPTPGSASPACARARLDPRESTYLTHSLSLATILLASPARSARPPLLRMSPATEMAAPPAPGASEIAYRPFDQTPADLAHIVRLVETELSEPYTVRPLPVRRPTAICRPLTEACVNPASSAGLHVQV